MSGLHYARAIPGMEPVAFDAMIGVVYPFGDAAKGYWQELVSRYTALIFVVWSDSDGSCVALAEASFDAFVAEAGRYAPQAFTVTNGTKASDRWGIDMVWPYWRFSVQGGKGRVGVYGIPRGL